VRRSSNSATACRPGARRASHEPRATPGRRRAVREPCRARRSSAGRRGAPAPARARTSIRTSPTPPPDSAPNDHSGGLHALETSDGSRGAYNLDATGGHEGRVRVHLEAGARSTMARRRSRPYAWYRHRGR
jgi:hypothetical protein